MIGPCEPWVTDEDFADDPRLCRAVGSGDDLTDLYVEASQMAFAALGRKYPGPCQATVRPVLRGSCCSPCSGPSAIPLHNPVVSIDEVRVDGEVVTDWHLRQGHILHRNTGSWPTTQKVYLADTEPDTFSIAYTFAAQPPLVARRAALEIAVNLWNVGWPSTAVDGALPAGTVAVSRQGMTETIDPERQASYPVLLQAVALLNPSHSEFPSEFIDGDPTWDLVVVSGV